MLARDTVLVRYSWRKGRRTRGTRHHVGASRDLHCSRPCRYCPCPLPSTLSPITRILCYLAMDTLQINMSRPLYGPPVSNMSPSYPENGSIGPSWPLLGQQPSQTLPSSDMQQQPSQDIFFNQTSSSILPSATHAPAPSHMELLMMVYHSDTMYPNCSSYLA
jgi:hypothetical protein